MGRNKLKIQKLETSGNRQVTYSKRRMGIMKKAKELSVLCDVDVLLVIFSTAGRPTLCMGEKSTFDQVIGRYSSLSPQERNKKRLESLEALRKTFKKADHVVDVEQLKNQGSEPKEEMKQRIRFCQKQINDALSELGPLAEFRNIDNISDINTIVEMEKKIIQQITHTRVQKEEYSANLAKVSFPVEHGLNQLGDQPTGKHGLYWFAAQDSQRFTLPPNLQLPQRMWTIPSYRDSSQYRSRDDLTVHILRYTMQRRATEDMKSPYIVSVYCDYNRNRDFVEHNMENKLPSIFSEQFTTWPQMSSTHQTVLNMSTDSMPQTEKSLCFENGKMDMILDSKMDNKGEVNDNWNMNKNQSACPAQDEWLNADFLNDLGEQQLSGISNGSSDIISAFFDNASFGNDNVNLMHESNFHNWTSGMDGGC